MACNLHHDPTSTRAVSDRTQGSSRKKLTGHASIFDFAAFLHTYFGCMTRDVLNESNDAIHVASDG